MNKISEAIIYATMLFDGQIRKAEKKPTIFHSLEVALIVSNIIEDEDVIAAAVLHDVVEDTNATITQIEEKFGKRVAFLVSGETENKYPSLDPSSTWKMRKEQSLKVLKETTDIGVKAMWLGDKLSNMRSFNNLYLDKGEKMWDLFNQKDPSAHEWYYRQIAQSLKPFEKTKEYQEFVELIDRLFGGH